MKYLPAALFYGSLVALAIPGWRRILRDLGWRR